MLTVQLPTLLALLGTALLAVVIFAPKPAASSVVASCAPPAAPPVLGRWSPLAVDPPALAPGWPAQVAARAAGCEPAARLALVDALEALRTPWAMALLARAAREDPDAAVRHRAAAALAGRSALSRTGVEPGDLALRQDVPANQEAQLRVGGRFVDA